MKYIFELSSRTDLMLSAEQKHQELITSLKLINEPWGISHIQEVPFPGFGQESVAQVSLDKYMSKKIKLSIFYRYRNMLEDHSLCDDRIYIEFNDNKVDYSNLVNVFFRQYIKGFKAYRAAIYTEEIMFYDFEKTRNKNLRETIIRFYPACYYDERLCLRALKQKPIEIANILNDKAEKAQLFDNGIIFNMGFNSYSIEDANRFDMEIRNCLDSAGN